MKKHGQAAHITSSQKQTRSVDVSTTGSMLRVERIELSDESKRSLTTSVKSVGSPRTADGSTPPKKK